MLKERFLRFFYSSRISANCVPHYLQEAKVLNCNPFDSSLKMDFLKELNGQNPACLYPAYTYTHAIMIRSLITSDIRR